MTGKRIMPEEKIEKAVAAKVESVEASGVKVAQVTYSHGGDLYKVGDGEKWLSVTVQWAPVQWALDGIFLGCVKTADGKGWRKVYRGDWEVQQPGRVANVPETDALVTDYAKAEVL
jgi:hypothetical protein